MRLYNMIGYKLYKDNGDGNSHMVRIVGMRKPFKIDKSTKDPSEITIYDYADGEKKKVRVDSLKEYSPIKPDGVFTISIAHIRDKKGNILRDVVATASKYINMELGLSKLPYAVCRQNITDVFYNLISTSEEDNLVGLSINQDTCPSNFDFRIMFGCESIEYSDYINFYRTDSLEDILSLFNRKKYNEVMKENYMRYVKHINKPELAFKSECGGWCKDIHTLFKINNFETDINQMLGITKVKFNISDYTVEKDLPGKEGVKYTIANDEFMYWLSYTYGYNITEASILKFDHDINLADFNNNSYFLFKDNTETLYLIVYMVDNEHYEVDLKAKAEELDFSTKFKIDFYNKYNKNNI